MKNNNTTTANNEFTEDRYLNTQDELFQENSIGIAKDYYDKKIENRADEKKNAKENYTNAIDSKAEKDSLSYEDMVTAGSEQQLAQQIGGALGFNKIDSAFNKSIDSADLKTQSGLEVSATQIKESGGMDNVIKVDKAAALEKAVSSTTSLDEKLERSGVDGGLSSEDSKKIAEELGKIATASGQADAGQALGQRKSMEAVEQTRGEGAFTQSFIDDAIPGALRRGKDYQYHKDWEDVDREKANEKMDNIQDYKVASDNFAPAAMESVFGGNVALAETVRTVAMATGANAFLGNPVGKALGAAKETDEMAQEAMKSGGAVGKDNNGKQIVYNPNNPIDKSEYIKHNKGANSELPSSLNGVKNIASDKSDSTSNNQDNSDKNNVHNNSLNNSNSNSIPNNTDGININAQNVTLDGVKVPNSQVQGAISNVATTQANTQWLQNKGDIGLQKHNERVSNAQSEVKDYHSNLINQSAENIQYKNNMSKENISNYVPSVSANSSTVPGYNPKGGVREFNPNDGRSRNSYLSNNEGATTPLPVPLPSNEFTVSGLRSKQQEVLSNEGARNTYANTFASAQQTISNGGSFSDISQGFKNEIGYSHMSARNIDRLTDRNVNNITGQLQASSGVFNNPSIIQQNEQMAFHTTVRDATLQNNVRIEQNLEETKFMADLLSEMNENK